MDNILEEVYYFDKRFDNFVYKKGKDVLLKKNIPCPCSNYQSNTPSLLCKNCAGTGYITIESYSTKMVLQHINLETKIKDWTLEKIGTTSVTTLSKDRVSFMDSITILDSVNEYTESIFLKKGENNLYFCYLTYNIESIIYLLLFISDNDSLQLIDNNLITFSENKIIFDASLSDLLDSLVTPDQINQLNIQPQITLRYTYLPVFYIIDVPRELAHYMTRDNQKNLEKEYFPTNAVAKRQHLLNINRKNYLGETVNNNIINIEDVPTY